MNVLIACKRPDKTNKIKELLFQYDASINIIESPSTIVGTLKFLSDHEDKIDLAILDSKLADGTSVDICNQRQFKHPFVFTSNVKSDAYEAIKVGCVDFLLEPVSYQDIEWSLKSIDQNRILLNQNSPLASQQKFKKRFIVKFGDRIRYIKADEIACIFAEGKLVYINTKSNGRRYIIEHTLDQLEKNHLDPDIFYRINRKFIVNIDSIEEVRNYANSRLKLIMNPSADRDMIVSRDKVTDFKSWLNL